MKLYFSSIVFLLLLGLAFQGRTESSAVRPTSGSWGASGRYQGLYEKGTRTKFEGRVLRTEGVVPLPDMEPGIQLRLHGEKGDVDVHLGPRWFVMERDMLFTKGEPLVVIGVTIRFGDKPTIIADQIVRGSRKDVLREPSGLPVWTKPAGKTVPE